MVIESRFKRAANIVLLASTSYGNLYSRFAPIGLPDLRTGFITVQFGQSNIEDDYCRLKIFGDFHSLLPIVCSTSFMPHESQHDGQTIKSIMVVVNKQ